METRVQYFDCLCRTCMNKVEANSYDGTTIPQQQWLSIFDIFEECGALRIAELLSDAVPQIVVHPSDELPKKICTECLQRLLSVYRFQQMCVQSDKEMHELLSKEEIVLQTPMLKGAIKCETETNDAETQPLKELRCSSTLHNLQQPLIQEALAEVTVQTIEQEAAESSAANHLQDNTQLLEYCNSSQGEFEEFVKNEPIEDDEEANSEYSDGDTIHSIISVTKEEVLPIEFEDKQVNDAIPAEQRTTHAEDKPYECPYCPLRFSSKTYASRHKTIHEGIKPHKCSICGKKFRIQSDLNRHKRIHSNEKPHKCDQCEMRFAQMNQLKVHIRTHTGEKPNKCKYCESEFASHSRLSYHLRSHLGENIHRCKFCPLAFSSSAELHLHLTSHKNEDPETRKRNLKALQEEEVKLRLRFSKEKSKGQSTEEQQQEKLCNKETEQQSTDSSRHNCHLCNKSYKRREYLTRHLNDHKKKANNSKVYCYACNLCSEQSIPAEQRTLHAEDKPYECPYCPLRFNSKSGAWLHKKNHEGIKPHKCSVCGKKFGVKSNLTRHKRIHSKEKPLKCDLCVKQYTEMQELKNHIRTHTGEKPYKCKYCERGFAASSVLRQHLRTHLGKNIHRCKFCPLTFPLSAEMRLHLISHKNEDPEVRERNLKALQEEEAKLQLKLSKEISKGQSTEDQQRQKLCNKEIAQQSTERGEFEEFIKEEQAH